MKGYAAVTSAAKQRRWKCLVVFVLLLVFFSMLVPLVFFLGLHDGFFVGYFSDERLPAQDSRAEQMLRSFTPSLTQEIVQNLAGTGDRKSMTSEPYVHVEQPNAGPMGVASQSESGAMTPFSKGIQKRSIDSSNMHTTLDKQRRERLGARCYNCPNIFGSDKSCQVEFGSYCLWSTKHKEAMNDATVKKLKDQLFVARAYYPSISKLQGMKNLAREMKQNIQGHERMLSDAISDADLPPFVAKVIQKMEQTIAKAKGCIVECSNVDRKLRQILTLTEDETSFHMKQSAFLYHLGVQTIPKSLHCLSMRLTVEYFMDPPPDMELSHAYKFDNPRFRHYVIFSRNVLAVSVTVNSTVMSSQNFYAMKLWFARNSFKEAVIFVLNLEDLNLYSFNNLSPKQLSASEEFRISVRRSNPTRFLQMKTEYVSSFGHSHFLLPEIFHNLKKVIVLEDDVIIQQDLSYLWDIDLQGKVNGASTLCELPFDQLITFLGQSMHDSSCLWMSGLNIIDLEKWREHNLTDIYQKLLHKFHNGSESTWRTATLPTSLVTFQGHIFPLDSSLVISGLGHNYGIDQGMIKNAVALHYNGNMKPWLDLGIPIYKKYWRKFLKQGERFMDECNVHY
ncbi:hypothetical protein HPP92_018076 [Vanilla planifolia]|uniref:Hexosyltransferase n=1 Tax=Vanilla planifolia TaxID=51239 RepID=A0A835UP27_VANPL|nr:hypothetical protein HPP92_018076 [Vanilla planifolia]